MRACGSRRHAQYATVDVELLCTYVGAAGVVTNYSVLLLSARERIPNDAWYDNNCHVRFPESAQSEWVRQEWLFRVDGTPFDVEAAVGGTFGMFSPRR